MPFVGRDCPFVVGFVPSPDRLQRLPWSGRVRVLLIDFIDLGDGLLVSGFEPVMTRGKPRPRMDDECQLAIFRSRLRRLWGCFVYWTTNIVGPTGSSQRQIL